MFSQLSTNKVDDVFSVVMFCWVVSSVLSQNMLIMASLLSLKSFKIVYVPLILYLFNFSFQCPWLYMYPLVFAHVLLVLRVGLCLCVFLFCIPQSPCFRVHPAPPLFFLSPWFGVRSLACACVHLLFESTLFPSISLGFARVLLVSRMSPCLCFCLLVLYENLLLLCTHLVVASCLLGFAYFLFYFTFLGGCVLLVLHVPPFFACLPLPLHFFNPFGWICPSGFA